MISLTPEARERLIDLLRDRNDIRLTLAVKGCGGQTFRFDFTDAELSDIIIDLGAERRLAVSTDCPSELSIGWNCDIFSPHFTFNSPSIVSTCGCGTSFKIE